MGPGGMMGAAPAASATTHWEYKTITRNAAQNWAVQLAKLGGDGWEVVCVTEFVGGPGGGQSANELLLKRKKQPVAMGGMSGMPGMGAGRPGAGPGMGAGFPGLAGGPPGGGPQGPPAEKVALVYTLAHLRVADLTPELRKQFEIIEVDETANSVSISANAKDPKASFILLQQLDTAAGKAKK
jgi:hypothetical protein